MDDRNRKADAPKTGSFSLSETDIELLLPADHRDKRIFRAGVAQVIQDYIEPILAQFGSKAPALVYQIVTCAFAKLPSAAALEREPYILGEFERDFIALDWNGYCRWSDQPSAKRESVLDALRAALPDGAFARLWERVLDGALCDRVVANIKKDLQVVVTQPGGLAAQEGDDDITNEGLQLWRSRFRQAVEDGQFLSPINRQAQRDTGLPFLLPRREELRLDE